LTPFTHDNPTLTRLQYSCQNPKSLFFFFDFVTLSKRVAKSVKNRDTILAIFIASAFRIKNVGEFGDVTNRVLCHYGTGSEVISQLLF